MVLALRGLILALGAASLPNSFLLMDQVTMTKSTCRPCGAVPAVPCFYDQVLYVVGRGGAIRIGPFYQGVLAPSRDIFLHLLNVLVPLFIEK